MFLSPRMFDENFEFGPDLCLTFDLKNWSKKTILATSPTPDSMSLNMTEFGKIPESLSIISNSANFLDGISFWSVFLRFWNCSAIFVAIVSHHFFVGQNIIAWVFWRIVPKRIDKIFFVSISKFRRTISEIFGTFPASFSRFWLSTLNRLPLKQS